MGHIESDHSPELLRRLIDHWEDELVEFKRAGNDYKTSEIGKHLSALANEANLRGAPLAYLVFGVDNATRHIVGSNYRLEQERLQSIKHQMSQGTEPSVTFRSVYEIDDPNGRIVVFEIPPAPRGLPISWNGHYYARAGESLVSLGIEKLDQIRNQTLTSDWSAQVVPAGTLDHLDSEAIQWARSAFARKHANRLTAGEVASWSDSTFLDRARCTQDGRITRTAILLLGKPEAAYLLNPHPVQVTWKLVASEHGYEHFGPPMVLTTSQLFQKVRNPNLRFVPEGQLRAIEVPKYDRRIVLEALHNALAHQDYQMNGRILLTELPDRLEIRNLGDFFDGCPDDYIVGDKTPSRYRNAFLVQAMTELNMIDTMGYGIHQMYRSQAARYLPLPDFQLHSNDEVQITVYGTEISPAYAQILIRNPDLVLGDIIALDRIQKGLVPDQSTAKRLKRAGVIEGRQHHRLAGDPLGFDPAHLLELLRELLSTNKNTSRRDIDEQLLPEFPETFSESEKRTRIGNLLTKWRRDGVIENIGSRTNPLWILTESMQKEKNKNVDLCIVIMAIIEGIRRGSRRLYGILQKGAESLEVSSDISV